MGWREIGGTGAGVIGVKGRRWKGVVSAGGRSERGGDGGLEVVDDLGQRKTGEGHGFPASAWGGTGGQEMVVVGVEGRWRQQFGDDVAEVGLRIVVGWGREREGRRRSDGGWDGAGGMEVDGGTDGGAWRGASSPGAGRKTMARRENGEEKKKKVLMGLQVG